MLARWWHLVEERDVDEREQVHRDRCCVPVLLDAAVPLRAQHPHLKISSQSTFQLPGTAERPKDSAAGK